MTMKKIKKLPFDAWMKKNGFHGRLVSCQNCEATGEVMGKMCPQCGGDGNYNTLKPKYEAEIETDRKRLEEFYGEPVEFIE